MWFNRPMDPSWSESFQSTMDHLKIEAGTFFSTADMRQTNLSSAIAPQ